MAVEPIESRLGFAGAVRVKAVPRISLNLAPLSPALKVKNLQETVDLRGTCDNVRVELPCTLTWVLARDGESDPTKFVRIAHSEPTVIVPQSTTGVLQGKPFKVQQVRRGTKEPVTLNVLKLGLYGKGRLGCEIALTLPTGQTASVAPASSQITVETEAGLELLDVNGKAVASSWRSVVGTKFRAQPRFGSAFTGKRVRITIREIGQGYSGENGRPHQFLRELTAAAPETEDLVIGFDGALFDYRSAPDADTLEYSYTIEFLKDGTEQRAPNTELSTGTLLKVSKPRLRNFSLSVQRLGSPVGQSLPAAMAVLQHWGLRVEGDFDGMDDAKFPVTVSLFARYIEGEASGANAKYFPVGLPPLTMHVEEGRFAEEMELGALRLDEWQKLVDLQARQLAFLAVLQFSTDVGFRAEKLKKGQRPRPIVFANVADYIADEGGVIQAGSPMNGDRLAVKSTADGVCSNPVALRDLTSVPLSAPDEFAPNLP